MVDLINRIVFAINVGSFRVLLILVAATLVKKNPGWSLFNFSFNNNNSVCDSSSLLEMEILKEQSCYFN